jgi:hypothetical protein
MSLDFLPDGFSLEDSNDRTTDVELTTDDAGNTFTVEVKRLSPSEFQRVARQLGKGVAPGIRPGSAAAERAETQVMVNLAKRVIVGWSGLTPANFEALDATGRKVRVDEGAEDMQIPYSVDAAAYLLRNSWGADFVDPILQAVKSKADEDEADLGN